MGRVLKEYLIISAAVIFVAVGVYFFKFPNHFSTGGVSGLSILFGNISTSISPGTFVMIINGLFLLIGFLLLDKSFGIKTVYCSILMSLSIRLFEIIFPLAQPLTDQKLLELIYSVIFPAIGSAILFNMDASTGGTDIAAMILKKYVPIDIGKALLCVDFLIASSSVFLFGIETGMYSVLGLLMKSMIVDSVIESINIKKSMMVITTHPDQVCMFITDRLQRGATFWEAEGAYTEEKKWVVMTAMNRIQANALRKYVKEVDPHAFMLITNTSSIIGKGFREV